MNAPAFTEGSWKATPIWYCISRGENLALAEHLMKKGADPNHSLWAATFRGDIAATRLLVKYGARLEDVAEDTTPFLGAVSWSRFNSAEELLKLGADPNFIDSKGMTALHYMLKKGSEPQYVAMVVKYGARGDIKNKQGQTAIDILSGKRDPQLRKLGEQLAARV
jgi:ankyrin repeat protein